MESCMETIIAAWKAQWKLADSFHAEPETPVAFSAETLRQPAGPADLIGSGAGGLKDSCTSHAASAWRSDLFRRFKCVTRLRSVH